jgi:hypothetical protein
MSLPAQSPPPLDWRRLHAFGLPAGSVRAILAVVIIGTVWVWVVLQPDQEVPDYLRDLLFIILGHYFAVRSRVDSTGEAGPPPLYLPRGTVRALLVLGFAVVAALLVRRRSLLPIERNHGAITLLLVFGFLLGFVMRKVSGWFTAGGHRLPRLVEDLRAAIALIAAVVLVVLVWNRLVPFLPHPRPDTVRGMRLHLGSYGPEHVLAAVIGFYFGSRS